MLRAVAIVTRRGAIGNSAVDVKMGVDWRFAVTLFGIAPVFRAGAGITDDGPDSASTKPPTAPSKE